LFEIVKPCQSCNSFVLKPKEEVNLDLEYIAVEIEKYSYETLAFTGSMLSIIKECKVNIYSSGKIVIMTKDLNRVENLAKELENVFKIKKV
tara:strand:- start:928 stop:1200 length:273 start_codon:yes stop_codon:yes gene_type:complete